jgi:hypothetical protein
VAPPRSIGPGCGTSSAPSGWLRSDSAISLSDAESARTYS